VLDIPLFYSCLVGSLDVEDSNPLFLVMGIYPPVFPAGTHKPVEELIRTHWQGWILNQTLNRRFAGFNDVSIKLPHDKKFKEKRNA
jgi:hypothetical protein